MNSPGLGDEFDGINLDEDHSPKESYQTITIDHPLDIIKGFTVAVQPEPGIVCRGQRCSLRVG